LPLLPSLDWACGSHSLRNGGNFPVKIINKEKVVPESLNFLFVEPGVQQILYVTKVPDHIMYLVVYAEFWYDEVTPHTSERVFRLTAPFVST
jgi:hypothetical protein